MKLSDWFGIPFKDYKPSYFIIWIFYGVITFLPGIFLTAITLGCFRYFHLSNLFCDYLVEKDLNRHTSDR